MHTYLPVPFLLNRNVIQVKIYSVISSEKKRSTDEQNQKPSQRKLLGSRYKHYKHRLRVKKFEMMPLEAIAMQYGKPEDNLRRIMAVPSL